MKFDNYIIEMENQVVLNNVHYRTDTEAQKISYAVMLLHETPKLSWLAAVRDGLALIVIPYEQLCRMNVNIDDSNLPPVICPCK